LNAFVAEREGFEFARYLILIIGVKIFLKNVVRSGVRVGKEEASLEILFTPVNHFKIFLMFIASLC